MKPCRRRLHACPRMKPWSCGWSAQCKMGEVVLAWIRLNPGDTCSEKEIRDFCQHKIAPFKIPEHVRFVDAFLMTVSGKVQKFIIREQEIRERGLKEVAHIRTA